MSSPTTTIFGPVELIRTTGAPNEGTWSFDLPGGMAAPFTLFVNNGFADGSARATAAWVEINGTQIFGTGDFGQVVPYLESDVTLQDSANALHLKIAGKKGSRIEAYITAVVSDTTAPVVAITSPEQGLITSSDSVRVLGTVVDEGTVSVAVNGIVAQVVDDSTFSATVPLLAEGLNVIAAVASDAAGNQATATTTVTRDTTTPVLTLVSPTDGLITDLTPTPLVGSVSDVNGATISVNGVPVPTDTTGAFADSVALVDGVNVLTLTATDPAGNQTIEIRTVTLDATPPVLTVNAPTDGLVTDQVTVTVSGSVSDATPVTVDANGVPLPVDGAGVFSGDVPLVEGANVVTVTATDGAGTTATVVRIVTRDTEPPVLTVDQPADGTVTTSENVGVSGTVLDLTAVTLTVNGIPLTVASDGTFSGTVSVVEGPNTLTFTATDAVGHTASATRSVTRTGGGGLPPDPATVAPPLDMTVATTTFAATEFLYTGANPIQTGVAPGTIEPVRVAVLRGRVTGRDGQPTSGVTISILDHPELGQTLTREDGAFDLAVNGGGDLTVRYKKSGLLPVQRTVAVPWQDYVPVDAVVMVALDPAVTTIDFSQPIEVHQATPQTDVDGTRQATLMFKQGTTAQMVMPDGSTQSLTSLNVRATEYTVGPEGPAAMPAALPPASGYTYAVELSADEAIAAGARSVVFSEPVSFYVENFLGFPTGLTIPLGYYDTEAAAWLAAPNGRVIAIVGGGAEDIDIDGDGAPDSADSLAAIGLDPVERARLVSQYGVGQSVWRLEVSHFTAWDPNHPSGPPPAATPPAVKVDSVEHTPNGCSEEGSVIHCQDQTLGEDIAIVGTAFGLHYRSDRVPGRSAARKFRVHVSGDTVPDRLLGIVVEAKVAGRVLVDTLPPVPDQVAAFEWDGLDAYGRAVQGPMVATVDVKYLYPRVYYGAGPGDAVFGVYCPGDAAVPGPCPVALERVAIAVQLSKRVLVGLGAVDLSTGLAGWTLTPHHFYSPTERALLRGTGDRRTTGSVNAIVEAIAGNGSNSFSGDGGLATLAGMDPENVAVAPDGTVYITDENAARIRRIDSDGIITTVAGSGNFDFAGDGGPALTAGMNPIYSVATADGSVYFADYSNHRIRRIDANGIVETLVGDGTCGSGSEGGAASGAPICYPIQFDVAPDGTIYWVTYDGLYMAPPDGSWHRIAGNGGYCESRPGTSTPCPYGGPALQMPLVNATGVAVGPDGSLYLVDNWDQVVKRIGPDGIIHQYAGDGNYSFGGDGGPALEASLDDPEYLAVSPQGTVYVTDGRRVRAIDENGVINTVLGTGTSCNTSNEPTCGDGGAAQAATVRGLASIALAPDGALYFSDWLTRRVRRVTPPLPGFKNTDLVVASGDGSEYYHFNPIGRHLSTRDATTGAVLYELGYDAAGLLVTVTDTNGNVTMVERDASGEPIAIVAPFGQRTMLTVGADGYLASIVNPAGETTSFTYGTDGLLASMTDARTADYGFTYDDAGLLILDADPAGGSTGLGRSTFDGGFEVVKSTALGRTTTYRVENLPDGGSYRVTTGPAGQVWETTYGADGTVSSVGPDGTLSHTTLGPDPRSGMQAPIIKLSTTSTPGGLVSTVSSKRKTVLADASDPFSLTSQLDSMFVNGRPFTQLYTSSDRTLRSGTPEGRISVARMDANNRLVEQTLPGVAAVNYLYDAQGRLASLTQGTRSWQYTYDASGRLATATDPLTRSTQFYYDAADRLNRQVLPDGREVGYAYDANGNLIVVTPSGRPAHTFQYSAVNLATEYRPPTVGATDPATSYMYDVDRALTRVQRPDGIAVDFTYDAGGRASQVTFPGGLLEYGYDPVTGNLTGVNGPYGGTLSMTYDGSLLTVMQWIGEVAGSVGAAYDNDFRLSTLSVNGAAPVTFGYDGDGLLLQAGALTAARDATSGRLTGTTLGGLTSAQSYNGFGELSGLTWSHGATPLLATSYTRDALGRIDTKVEVVGTDTTTWSYHYDLTGRLTQVDRDGVAEQAYTYDANGNRTSLTNAGGVITATYDAQDRLLTYGTNSYTYTANGELTAKIQGVDTTQYTYDVLGNLLAVELPSGPDVGYVVDPVGRRTGRKVGGVLQQGWLYQDGLNPIAELDGSGAVVSRFVYGTRANVPDYMVNGGVTYRIVSDELGSVRQVVDVTTGVVAQEVAYDAWGRVLVDTNPGFQPFGYAGGLYDPVTGLVRFGVRDYDAEVGRWTAKDPIGFESGNSNLYLYASGDPLTLVDPDGQIPILPIVIGIAGGLAFDYLLQKIEEAVCDCPEGGTALGPAGNAALGGALGAAGDFAEKSRTGVAGGGTSGMNTSILSEINHELAREGLYSTKARNLITKYLRAASKGLGAAAAIISIVQILEALTCG